MGDICAQGFPFYSGRLSYRVPLPEQARRLKLPGIGAACAVVNGQVLGREPFEADVSDCGECVEVELVLPRPNTFGPFHDAVKDRPCNHPDLWLLEGDEFIFECILEESGLVIGPLFV